MKTLPEKWCIKVTDDNESMLTEWLCSKSDFDKAYAPIKGWVLSEKHSDNSYQIWAPCKHPDYEEITTEQFKKHVLKQFNKVKLEVDKWYKWLWTVNKEITYGKCYKVLSDSFNVSEGIHNNVYAKVNGYFHKDCENLELLTDLSEIQQYLPEGHPDKIKSDDSEEYVELNETHVGSIISLYWNSYFYDHVLVTVKDSSIYLLNNYRSNNDGHGDKSKYRYSLRYDDWETLNRLCRKIKLIGKPTEQSSTSKIDMLEIQKQAMEKFPIGCIYTPLEPFDPEENIVLKKDDTVYSIHNGDQIYAHCGGGLLYRNGQWAKLIEKGSKDESSELKVGDWVVLLKPSDPINWAKEMEKYVGLCVKLTGRSSSNPEYFKIEEDRNFWSWEYSERVKHFRKATNDEIILAEARNAEILKQQTTISIDLYDDDVVIPIPKTKPSTIKTEVNLLPLKKMQILN